jgi:hypothetical protein
MRECLEANLRFLKKDKEALLAQKACLEGRKGPISADDKIQGAQSSDQSSAGRSWFSIGGGISAIGRGLSRGIAYFTPSTSAEGTSRMTRDAGWSQLAVSGQEKRLQRKDRTAEENRAVISSPLRTDSCTPHRAVRHNAGADAERLNKNQGAVGGQAYESPRAVRYGRQ